MADTVAQNFPTLCAGSGVISRSLNNRSKVCQAFEKSGQLSAFCG